MPCFVDSTKDKNLSRPGLAAFGARAPDARTAAGAAQMVLSLGLTSVSLGRSAWVLIRRYRFIAPKMPFIQSESATLV
jgi:hypothetical protein